MNKLNTFLSHKHQIKKLGEEGVEVASEPHQKAIAELGRLALLLGKLALWQGGRGVRHERWSRGQRGPRGQQQVAARWEEEDASGATMKIDEKVLAVVAAVAAPTPLSHSAVVEEEGGQGPGAVEGRGNQHLARGQATISPPQWLHCEPLSPVATQAEEWSSSRKQVLLLLAGLSPTN